jgi:parallel beta helix pectate lyase-like protein
MRTIFSIILLCVIIASPVFAGTITVAQDGSGDVNSIQAAVATIANGDEIIILDSAIYEEDLTAGAGAGFAAQFTMKAAEGQTPTIRAINTAERLGDLGIPGIDRLGVLVSGCVGAVFEGIIFENQTTEVAANDISSAIALMDCNDTTLRNCTIKGAGGQGTAYAGFNFGIIIYGATLAPAGIVMENCLVEECHYGVQVIKATEGVPTDPSITLRGCTIQNCNGNGIEIDCASLPNPADPARTASGAGHLIEDTLITNCQNPATLGGGKIVFRNCSFLGNRGYVSIDKQATGEFPILAEFDDVAIIGSGNMGIRVNNGNLNMTNCIVAGCLQEGLFVVEDGEEAIVSIDHCDFYQNLIDTPESFELRLDPPIDKDRILNVSNTNVVGVAGLFTGKLDDYDYFEEGAFTASYCNVLAEFDAFLNVTLDNEMTVDPMYVNPTTDPNSFSREGFQLQEGSPVLTAASDGGYIGSQGPLQVGVSDWMTY